MCGVCGCGEGMVVDHAHEAGQEHKHSPEDAHFHHHHEHHSHGIAHHAHAPGISPSRIIKIEQDILAENNRYAAENRNFLAQRGILALNLVSSPGSGKTSLLVETIRRLQADLSLAVIEGDQQTNRDAERIQATGVKVIQINTGKGCHLDAHRVGHAFEHLELQASSVLFIENVGNLVCPASFDLGEAHKVVVLSVTEGEDKPLKYPDMFHAADLMLLNKTDLLPYLDFDTEQCLRYARQVNPKIKIIQLSAKTGEGMDVWLQWVRAEANVQSIAYS